MAGLLFGTWPILREAFENINERRMTMELSMSIAILAAAAISEFFTALIVTFFVLVAEELVIACGSASERSDLRA